MKIVLIIPTLNQGGAERVMSGLANEFIIQKHDVHLVLLAKSNAFYDIDTNVHIHKLGFENNGGILKAVAEVKTFFLLRKLLKKERPDVVLSFMEKYNVLTLLASRFLNLKIFVSDRSNPRKLIPSYISFLRNHLYKYATGIIAQTSLAKDILEKTTGNHNILVIPNPVKKIQKYPSINRENIIINVGRLVPEKGQKFLIEAFSQIKNDSWKLVILGDGSLKEEIIEQATLLGIENRLSMPGSVTNVDEWLAKSSIFAFPSVSEGFPNALVEAMASGLPCVSFNCDAGPKEIIDDGVNGFLISTRNVEQLQQKLELLIEDEELRRTMGICASEIVDVLRGDKIAGQYLDFFKGMKLEEKVEDLGE